VAFEHGLAPVSLGLLFSSGLTVLRSADHSVMAYAISAATLVILLRTKLSPLVVMAAAGVLGAFGWVG